LVDCLLKRTLDKIKVLGVTLPTNGKIEDLMKLNFEEKKHKIKDIVHSWSKRSLTSFGKVTIINSLIIPQITYVLSILPNPEISYFKEIDKVIFSFLCNNKPPKLSRTIVLRKIAFGGLQSLLHISRHFSFFFGFIGICLIKHRGSEAAMLSSIIVNHPCPHPPRSANAGDT
jgi:hypothetical protein